MTTLEQEVITDNITRLELALNAHLSKAVCMMEDLRRARQEVTDAEMKRCGWGWNEEMAEFHNMAEWAVYDIKCHITEFGGGCTDKGLVRINKMIAAMQ